MARSLASFGPLRRATLHRRAASLLSLLVAAVVVVIVVFPLYQMVVTALEPSSHIYDYPPNLFPPQPSLTSFENVFRASALETWLINSAVVSLLSTVLALLISSFAAYSLSRFRFHGRLTIAFAILVTQMLPGTLFVIPLYKIFLSLNLTDTLTGLIIAYTTFNVPVAIWMLKGFFDGIPVELGDAALIDGCTHTAVFWRVIAPLSLPGFTCAAIFCFINSWNEFLFARTFLSSSSNFTVSVGLSTFIQQYTVSWDQIMAGAAIGTVPVLVAYILLQRYLVQGLTAGAVKG